jgi:hypothetical protein
MAKIGRRGALGCLKALVSIAAFIVGSIVALVVVLLGADAVVDTYRYHFGFDSENWISMREPEDRIRPDVNWRSPMIPDLLAHHPKVGMSVQEVVQLLGQPENRYPALSAAPIPNAPA